MLIKPLLIAEARVGLVELEVLRGSALAVEAPEAALVNAANEHLSHIGGIAHQISLSGGPQVQSECEYYIKRHGSLRVAQAISTTAGELDFQRVIHVVGPRCHTDTASDREKADLIKAVTNAFAECNRVLCQTLVCPIISSGIFGFPVREAITCHLKAFLQYAKGSTQTLKKVVLCVVEEAHLTQMVTALLDKTSGEAFSEQCDYFHFLGTPAQQGLWPGKGYCTLCCQVMESRLFSITQCACKSQNQAICNYCIYQQCLNECLNCRVPYRRDMINFDYLICRHCGLTKQVDFHSCRLICYSCYQLKVQERKQDPTKCVCGEIFQNNR